MNRFLVFGLGVLLLVGGFWVWGQRPLATPAEQPYTSRPFATPNFTPGETIFTHVASFPRLGDERLIGQAWGDVDGDGRLDLYLTDPAGPNQLWRNRGSDQFEPISLPDTLSLPAERSSGAIFADYDNDGWQDLLVLNNGANRLFRNSAGEGFTDVTTEAGLTGSVHSKTASWGDYDEDGYLDLYIANWSCSPECGRPMEGDKDQLYHNNGDGTFTDVTDALSRPRGAGFVASFVDYDNDGDLDIYLVNDSFINPIGNILWRNEGTAEGCRYWCFTDVAEEANVDTVAMGMGLATADYDNDGDFDFYFSNAGPMTLLRNQGNGQFEDFSQQAGVDLGMNTIGWGAVFFDFDNDGWQDIYLAVSDRLPDGEPADMLLQNNGRLSFIPRGNTGLDTVGRTLGVAYADYNQDGWVDLVVGHFDGSYELYRNNGVARPQQRIAVDLVGGGNINRDAVGARVKVLDSNGRSQLQEVKSGSSLGAGDTRTLHFGLGEANIVQLQVIWPDGTTQTLEDLPADRWYTFTYPAP